MRFGAVLGTASVILAACSKDPPPPVPPAAPMQAPPAPAPVTTATARTTSGAPGDLATPGPTALSCQSDAQCLGHRCNLPVGRCAFPCVADSDCVSGATCFLGGGPAAFCIATKTR